MKPGLRKVAALILATATLFGSGASAVSAAYADDTTMGTSTRIQAEPDVKTTTGGDEAATKPDTGSGDEAGTGADEQSGTGAPAQSAPQADAGQAAPDVTVHDMLDTDSAAVSRLRLTDRITGTAPFDADNERGDDKDETTTGAPRSFPSRTRPSPHRYRLCFLLCDGAGFDSRRGHAAGTPSRAPWKPERGGRPDPNEVGSGLPPLSLAHRTVGHRTPANPDETRVTRQGEDQEKSAGDMRPVSADGDSRSLGRKS